MRASPDGSSCAASPQVMYKGMTLIELLVAISVLAVIAALGWRGLDSIARARVALAADLEQTRGMQLTFAQMQSDCAHLADATALQGRRPLAAGPGRLTLVRTVLADNQPSRLQVIAYRVKDGVLTRRESAATRDLAELDVLWRAAASDTDRSQAVVLQSGVDTLTMRLWANDGWHMGDDTPLSAAGMNAGLLAPTGLEVALQLRARDARLLKIFLLGAA